MRAAEQADRSAEEIRHIENLFRCWKHLHDVGISRHQGAHFDVVRSQRDRERADDIGEAAGLDDRIDFGGDRENAK